LIKKKTGIYVIGKIDQKSAIFFINLLENPTRSLFPVLGLPFLTSPLFQKNIFSRDVKQIRQN